MASLSVDQWIDSHEKVLVEQLQALLRIPSVLSAPQEDAPFGIAIRQALDFTLALCRSFGFTTCNLDGKIGYAEYGEGDEVLGVLCHLDVVEADGEWRYPPFGGAIVDGHIVARGIQDDKGPVIAAIYALAAIKASNVKFRRKVRLIFGCDEENQLRCLEHYFSIGETIPTLSFSPDGEYPVVNGELHICSARYIRKYASSITVTAGTAVNAVPATAQALIPLSCDSFELKLPSGFRGEKTPAGKMSRISVFGTAAHASVPHLGKNALAAMLLLLNSLPLPADDKIAVHGLSEVFGLQYHGENVGLDYADESGRLTLNLGILEWNHEGYTLDIDVRAPISMEEDLIREKLRKALEGQCEETSFTFSRGFYLPESTELVAGLQKAFAARYGKVLPPIQIGGGTYARDLPNAVSFGPLLPGKADQCHMTNESMSIEDLIFNTKVIADAIVELAVEN